MARILREHFKERMKIEMAPWAKAYTVDMKDMYTELTLDKIENKPSGPSHSKISNYKDLFRENQDCGKRQDDRGRKKSKIPIIKKENHKTPIKEKFVDYRMRVKQSKIPIPSKTVKKATRQASVGTKSDSAMGEKVKTEVKEKHKGDRVLLKAEQGFGKTTLSRKITWDWAMSIFTTFSIVFFVSLKLVRPGDVIENIIIQQTPPLEGMNVTPNQLKKILNTFGHRCLIIFDGLDEIPSKVKPEIEQIIKGRKLYYCNIFLTSRPHTVAEFENDFQRVARLQGFTREHTDKLINKFFTDEKQRSEVQKFTTKHGLLHDSLHTCPILLVFICILSQNGHLDTTASCITTGDIYLKLVRSLYRKYCVRKSLPFKEQHFLEVLHQVGNLALQCLQTGNYLLERDEVLSTIGDDAFEYGFFSGHEDFRLLGDAVADVFITFPHRTIQDFFGAFSFVFSILDGINIDSFIRIFLTNVYFLEFSLFAIAYIPNVSKKTTGVKEAMVQYALDRINLPQLDLSYFKFLFPALLWSTAVANEQKLVVKFLKELLSKCDRVKFVLMNLEEFSFGIFDAIKCLFPNLHCIYLNEHSVRSDGLYLAFPPELYPGYLNLIIYYQHADIFLKIKAFLTALQRKICLFVLVSRLEPEVDFSVFMCPEISKIQLMCCGNQICRVSFGFTQQRCDQLTHISIKELHVTKSCLVALSNANKAGYFPVLSHVEFPDCHFVDNNNIVSLFQSTWPNISALNVNTCFLSKVDVDVLSNHDSLLPSLNSLSLYLGENYKLISEVNVPVLARFRKVGQNNEFTLTALLSKSLTHLQLRDIDTNNYIEVTKSVNRRSLPNLTDLCMSLAISDKMHWVRKMFMHLVGKTLMHWMRKLDVPSLQSLTIHRFIYSMETLYMFTQTPVLTQLYKLDISHSSGVTGVLSILLCHSFPALETLILSDCWLNSDDLRSLAQGNTKGRLPKVKYLDISQNQNIKIERETFFCYAAQWEELHCLKIDGVEGSSDVFSQQNDCLINLKEIVFHSPGKGIIDENSSKRWMNLTKVEMACVIKDFTNTVIGFVHNVERGNLPSLKTIKIHVLSYVIHSCEFLPKLWETLNKKLKPSVCKRVMISLTKLLQKYSSDDSISQLSNDMHFSEDELVGKTVGDFFQLLDDKLVGKIVDYLVTEIILEEPMTGDEKDFLHNTLTSTMSQVMGSDEQKIGSPFFTEVHNIPTLKQRLHMRNVCVFTYFKIVPKRTKLNEKYYR